MKKKEKAILSTFTEFFKSFQRNPMPTISLQYDPEAKTIFTGFNELYFNNICIKKPTFQEKLLIEIKALQKKHQLPLTVWITHESEEPTFETLLKENFESPGPFYSMMLDVKKSASISCSEQISIESIETPEQAKEFTKIYCNIFNLQSLLDTTEEWAIKQYELDNPTCISYIARVNGIIAGISSLVIDRNFHAFKVGGLYNDAVLPFYRKNGVATAMASYRIQAAKQLGIEKLSVILESDLMARGYYERLGFKNYKTITPYLIK